MSPDIVNGLFEFCGGGFLLYNCWKTYLAKQVKGVSILTTTFFAGWGCWNLFYYPHLDQWWSFAGGLVIFAANALWVGMMVYYTRRERVGQERQVRWEREQWREARRHAHNDKVYHAGGIT